MIKPDANPVEWALLVDELSDAHEHLGDLIKRIMGDASYDESGFRVDMGHVMAHLNRAWARRDIERSLTDAEWEAFREYHAELRPIA
jgi:hypothetical protein